MTLGNNEFGLSVALMGGLCMEVGLVLFWGIVFWIGGNIFEVEEQDGLFFITAVVL